ncbi:hypothetical protein [Flavobacterium sp. GCM10023249]|uniref:hypothetical protein n=1 Tax=unclassified Flavobacterium TaxID=196869 RepID=UPI003617B4A6
MKLKIIAFLLFVQQISLSQEKINTFSYEINKPKNVVTLTDDINEKVVFIYNYKTQIDFLLFDDTMSPKGKISESFAEKENRFYLGYSFSDNLYYTYWAKDNTIEVKELDFATNTVKTSQIDLISENKGKVISYLSENGKCYILSSSKGSNLLTIFVLEKNAAIQKTVDLKDMKFLNSDGGFANFNDICWEGNGAFYKDGFRVMSNNTFPSLVSSTQKKKIFLKDDVLTLCFDYNSNFTQTLSINLKDFSASQKVFNKQFVTTDNQLATIDSNSYIINNHVFQIKTIEGKIYLSIKDAENNEVKNILYQIDNFGTTYNSDLTEEIGSITKKTILEKPNQFVRRVNRQNPSISGYFENDKYHITLGGVSYPQQNSGAFIGGAFGGLIGGIVGALVAGNTSNLEINSYANKIVVHTKIIFDSNFNHVAEKAQDSKLENLRKYIETQKDQEFQLVYSLKNKLYLTSYNKELKQTTFYQF